MMGEPKKENLPQLRMGYRRSVLPSTAGMPAGYQLRCFEVGDEQMWVNLLNANAELGEWTLERIAGILTGGLRRQFFAVTGSQLVACAGVHEALLDGVEYWEIGWVASHPEHRGQGLGAQVTAAALAYALSLPPRSIVLRTDDFRLPAIKIYLKLGFTPFFDHSSYPERWRLIGTRLGPGYELGPQDGRP